MAQFTYKARRPSGELVEGSLDSADKASALGQIDRLGLYPVSVQQTGGTKAQPRQPVKRTSAGRPAPRPGKIKAPTLGELAGFSQQLANLLNSGMTVTVALNSMTSLETVSYTHLTLPTNREV